MKLSVIKTVHIIIGIFLSNITLIANSQLDNPPQVKTIFQALADKELIQTTIEINLDTLFANKMKAVYQPATIHLETDNGYMTQDIKVRVRGRSRRRYCDFPPLKLKFSKEKLAAVNLKTDYGSLKLVTHCKDTNSDNILEEYLAYKLYNVLTDKSFQVRLTKVTYVDVNTGDSFENFGILLENTDELANRLGGKEDETMGLTAGSYDNEYLRKLSVFQYMIGNEDWRLPFLRNVKHVQLANGDIIPVPYDFDASGIVNATYAKPDVDLQLSSVLQRQFMGRFADKEERATTINFFISKKEALYQEIQSLSHLDTEGKKIAMRYIDSFFDIIEDKNKLNKAMPLKNRKPEPTDSLGVMQ